MATIMTRYSRTFRHHPEPGPTMQQWHDAMDLLDEVIRANDEATARLVAAARREEELIEQVEAAVRVSGHLQEKLDALRAHRVLTEGAGR